MSNIERESNQVTLEPNTYENQSTSSPFKASPAIKKSDKLLALNNLDAESGFATDRD